MVRSANARETCEARKSIVIASGNKSDLTTEREVPADEARQHFASMNPPIPYFEVSAKTGAGVNEVFEYAARLAKQRFLVADNENE